MGWFLLRLTVKIVAFLRLTVIYFHYGKQKLNINFHCVLKVKKLISINEEHILGFRPFWDDEVTNSVLFIITDRFLRLFLRMQNGSYEMSGDLKPSFLPSFTPSVDQM